MRTYYFNLEVLALFVLSFIPWPGPTVFKISCPRDSATVVRRIIQKRWVPVLDKYKVKIPMECPFHPSRDIFSPQQSAKQQHRPSQWTCGLCGKSFYSEAYLDMHFENRHKNVVNMAEDAVCLADYCDIMRCDVVRKHIMSEPIPGDGMQVNTDIEIWRDAASYHTALSPAGPRELARVSPYNSAFRQHQTTTSSTIPPVSSPSGINSPSCSRGDSPAGEGESNNTDEGCDNLVDSAVPPKQRISEFQRLKANCKPDVLQNVKTRCEILVRDCIAGLLVNLSTRDFQEIEEELNYAVCWYLTCDRYWEDSPSDLRPFPWGLLFVLVMALSLFICLCYYIVWVLFDSDDATVASASVTASSSPARHSHYSEEYYPVSDDLGQNEHYIYVTYPPDLKRRLLERTTRL
ncbi:ZnF_C2H2 [Nesidiocoris tenuis]|uniref:ZnF_C2H2 n=1 Tax=Nesidiocoris tenuis TaxID=355587 RepID=A0ABN7A9I6_9HEMI|nr:ZnF_C2H2 [Nesidiocoris tenuis]